MTHRINTSKRMIEKSKTSICTKFKKFKITSRPKVFSSLPERSGLKPRNLTDATIKMIKKKWKAGFDKNSRSCNTFALIFLLACTTHFFFSCSQFPTGS